MIKSVSILPGCISCKNCEVICPKVFRVNPTSQVITDDFAGIEEEILLAETMCPVQVIKVEKGEGTDTKTDGESLPTEDTKPMGVKQATLVEKTFLTPDTLELKFSTSEFSFLPGQYIAVKCHDEQGEFSRNYSIMDGNDTHFILTIKIPQNSRGPQYLKSLNTGDQISYLWALGDFTLQNNTSEKVFIATGTGLAPIIAMLKNTAAEIKKTVIFGVRYEQDIYYAERLKTFPNTEVIITISRPKEGYQGHKGRVTEYLSQIQASQEVYICGNPEMVESVQQALQKQKHPQSLIFSEKFSNASIKNTTGEEKGITQKKASRWEKVVIKGDIPSIKHIETIVLWIALWAVPMTWLYNALTNNLYGNFLFMQNFMGFLFDLSRWSVVFVMAIRPLADLFPKIWLFRKLISLRKAFGILSAGIILTNLIGGRILNNSFSTYLHPNNRTSLKGIIPRLSEITALILFLTSNTFSQKKLGIWRKRIQRCSYIYFITGGIVAALYFPLKIYPVMAVVIILWTIAQIKNRHRKKKRKEEEMKKK